jgi:uncharacterized membrane protein
MENNTLAFFIGVQNLCISHNKSITSLQWMLGNLFFFISVGIALWFYFALRKVGLSKIIKRFLSAYWIIAAAFFLVYNAVSLSMPIDEREAMEEVLKKKPELAQKVRNELEQLKSLGHEIH